MTTPEQQPTLKARGDLFVARWSYLPARASAARAIPGSRFEDGAWLIPATSWREAKALAAQFRMDVSPGALALFERGEHSEAEAQRAAAEARAAMVAASSAADADVDVAGLGGTLRPFQRAGVVYATKARRAFVADEMGLGKTIQALASIQAANAYPALVICPASLKLNWQREAERWLPGRSVSLLNGKAADYTADVVIINYDILAKHAEALKACGFQAVVLDESHYLKNEKAKRTKLCMELVAGVPMRLCLTGTPVVNRPIELVSQLDILGQLNAFGGFWPFVKRYCGAKQGAFGWDMSGATNLAELNDKLRATCYIRRTKADVLLELPAKQRATLPLALDNRRDYDRAERDLIAWLRDRAADDKAFLATIADLPSADQAAARAERAFSAEQRARRAEQLVRIEALKQLAAQGKLAAAKEWIGNHIESGEKLIVFAQHTAVVEAIASAFGAPTITGDTSVEARQAAVDRFQNDPACTLIVLNIRAGGVGLTLTAASNVAFVELDWTPAAHDQAEDRAHRIGQHDAVTAWYLLAERSIDQRIAALIDEKRAVVDAATEGGDADEDRGILAALIAQLVKGA